MDGKLPGMAELDGIWDVRRTGGMLPPLVGVSKRIHGDRGETRVGRLLGVPFRVEGAALHYRAPFDGFVDRLEPAGPGRFSGTATFRGRPFGRFDLIKRQEALMADSTQQLVKHIDEAYAMEQNVLRMLDGMISTTDDPQVLDLLEHHRQETQQQAERLKERLDAHGATPSTVREWGGILGALAKLPLDLVRTEKVGRNARDAFATEHMEIAAYQLLERIARAVGDEETVAVASMNRGEEEAMAYKLDQLWDRFAELSMQEEGIPTSAT
jgi:ferritin-like metal-binding protein YciE